MSLAEQVRQAALPLESAADLGPLLRRMGDARVVMLGEATHGTREFYALRAALTERLIAEHGFSFVAVEGDWPDCKRVDRHVKGQEGDDAARTLRAFARWPTWMWANEEVAELAAWMRGWNEGHPLEPVGFFGLDVYSLWDSMEEVVRYLEERDPEAAGAAREAYACFGPYMRDEHAYAASTRWIPESCESEVVAVLARIAERGVVDERDFDAEQNAFVAANAEAYYRAMVRNDADSWNVRDRHMMETLDRLLRAHGPRSKAVVWAHNTHVGDARATDMARAGMVNLGQLARERYGMDDTFAVGFGTHRGTVVAGRSWGARMEEMRVPPAVSGSWEDVMHEATEGHDALFLLRGAREPEWRALRGHRAIGVVYDPAWESPGNYVPTDLPGRYDAFVHLDATHALRPLHAPVAGGREPPETFPSGM